MGFTVAERQQKSRKVRREKNLALVQVWVSKERVIEIKAIAARMMGEKIKAFEPSPRQIAFAQFLCDKKGLRLPQDILSSSTKLSEWLNENKNAKDRVGG